MQTGKGGCVIHHIQRKWCGAAVSHLDRFAHISHMHLHDAGTRIGLKIEIG